MKQLTQKKRKQLVTKLIIVFGVSLAFLSCSDANRDSEKIFVLNNDNATSLHIPPKYSIKSVTIKDNRTNESTYFEFKPYVKNEVLIDSILALKNEVLYRDIKKSQIISVHTTLIKDQNQIIELFGIDSASLLKDTIFLQEIKE